MDTHNALFAGGISTLKAIYEKIEDGYKVTVSKEFYEKEAVFATAYKFEKKFTIKIEPDGTNNVAIFLCPKSSYATDTLVNDFLGDLIDQQLRLDIAKRTDPIRKRIYDEAFKPIGVNSCE